MSRPLCPWCLFDVTPEDEGRSLVVRPRAEEARADDARALGLLAREFFEGPTGTLLVFPGAPMFRVGIVKGPSCNCC